MGLGVLLGFQILTGLFLSIHYTADIVNTFSSVIHIIRDAPMGWLFRNLHANGASLFFFYVLACWSWFVLSELYFSTTYVNSRCNYFTRWNGYRFLRVCFSFRADVFLRCHCYY